VAVLGAPVPVVPGVKARAGSVHGRALRNPWLDSRRLIMRATPIALRLLVLLTLTRIVLTPVVMALILVGDSTEWVPLVAAGLFAVAAATDFIDGRLARRWEVTTTLGSFLDTTADKFLVTGVLIALVQVGHASAWPVAIIVGRELAIIALRGVVASTGVVLSPSAMGKTKTAVQFLAVILAIVRPELQIGPLLLDEWVMLAAAVITVLSAVGYFRQFAAVLAGEAVATVNGSGASEGRRTSSANLPS
jgi:CDP-diacylglycerol--glycerol-3-phosphate 3-phosphatidyltransferase